MSFVSLAEATAPLVLALDAGTSSVRALVFDRHARAVSTTEEQLRYHLHTTADGGAETDADALLDLLLQSIDGTFERIGERAAEIVAVGMTSFWHSLLGLDRHGKPVTPVLMWADTRSAPFATALSRQLNPVETHARTGCRFHSSYWPAKIAWLTARDSRLSDRVARWVGFAEYAAEQLHGDAPVTISMASGTGLLDVHRLRWDNATLAAVGGSEAQMSPLAPDGWSATLSDRFARRWPRLAEIPWYPALGDGACANVGSGAIDANRIALTLGTSGALRVILPTSATTPIPALPAGLWAYRLDRDHAVVGGALSNGGNLLAWLGNLLSLADDSPTVAAAAALPPDSHGLTILPFVSGERAPGWYPDADGTVSGLTLATKPEHILRAAIESVAYRFASVYDDLVSLIAPRHEIVANGGALLESPDRLQLVADVLGHDVVALPPEAEASARGAAAMALIQAGVIPDLQAVPDPGRDTAGYRADAARYALYQVGRARHQALEARLFPAETAAPPRHQDSV